MKKPAFATYINSFDFVSLFTELGWDNFSAKPTVEVGGTDYTLQGIAEKRGFAVLECRTQTIPDRNTQQRIEQKLTRLYAEHLIIFASEKNGEQVWQLPVYAENKPKRLIPFCWHTGQDAELLFERFGYALFTLSEEDDLTLADVQSRVYAHNATNNEQVIKKFYEEFKKQHKAFLAFITGIDDAIKDERNTQKQWYTSLMLNRLMFCYFIQKKRFLDGNANYLKDKLRECKQLKAQSAKTHKELDFYSFYRLFLVNFFHNELAKPAALRIQEPPAIPFGKIPYLNGGLFDMHELEKRFAAIQISDEAFERLFAFFDEWNWTLDTRTNASGKDINPDVLGYIYEKYINDRAAMGAYYTKEDITEYMSKNTILPFLLDKVRERLPALFEAGGGFWQFVQDSGDEYMYDAVKHGIPADANTIWDANIPDTIKIGIDTAAPKLLERRKNWNTATPAEFGLPTEIWRETITRWARYFDVKRTVESGGIAAVNDLITYNLNIRKLAQDYLAQTQSVQFINEFYTALTEITILDPTCGSGAFLFAALNILEPLYEVCMERRQELGVGTGASAEHGNLKYAIYKKIILNNLYGADIMKEAAEIAKLRLFLKLAAEVEANQQKPNMGLEPLPDIDFNIKSGNTLVGFATEAQLHDAVKEYEGVLQRHAGVPMYQEKLDELCAKCNIVADVFRRFQELSVG